MIPLMEHATREDPLHSGAQQFKPIELSQSHVRGGRSLRCSLGLFHRCSLQIQLLVWMGTSADSQFSPETLIWVQIKHLAVLLKGVKRLVPKPLLYSLLGLFFYWKVNLLGMIFGRWRVFPSNMALWSKIRTFNLGFTWPEKLVFRSLRVLQITPVRRIHSDMHCPYTVRPSFSTAGHQSRWEAP